MQERTRAGSRPWWARPRYRLRVLVIMVLVIGGWLVWFTNSARVQGEAVAAIRGAGGFVAYDWEWRDRLGNRNAKPRAPGWLVDQLGVDYFGHVVYVWLGEPASDEVFAQIGHLDGLEVLYLSDSRAADASLAPLRGLARLRTLYLDRTRITDAGLAHLEGLYRLEELSLDGTAVTDAGLAHLGGLTRLRQLHLSTIPITGAGLAHLGELKRLDTLSLSTTRLDDSGMTHLERLTGLQTLDLTNDAGITDVGLSHLKGLTNLRNLYLRNVKIRPAALEELRRALPRLKVDGWAPRGSRIRHRVRPAPVDEGSAPEAGGLTGPRPPTTIRSPEVLSADATLKPATGSNTHGDENGGSEVHREGCAPQGQAYQALHRQ